MSTVLAPERSSTATDAAAGGGRPDGSAYGRFGYHAGLDGIRGVAVLVVVLFHAGSPVAPGGLLGVSVFFTLSGYLITRLLLDESARSAAIDLPAFWARRLRRLLPAALAGVVLVLALAAASALVVDPDSLQLDVFGALGYVANWRFLFGDASYADLFSQPSPLLHYWSLAIEEQFYLLYPLLAWLVLRRAPNADAFRVRLRIALLVGIGASLVVTLVAARSGDFDFVYYSLPSRAGELLIGGVAATLVGVARVGAGRAPRWLTLVGFAALTGILVLCTTSISTDGWIGHGGLLPFALVSATLIVAATPTGPLASVLGAWPLRGLGLISYGVYVYHWPIILWLTPERVGFGGTALVLLQMVVTIALAYVSYRLLERPIRTRTLLRGAVARFAAPAGIIVMAVGGFVVTSNLSVSPRLDFAGAAEAVNAGESDAPPAAAPGTAGAPTVAFFGDSSGLATAKAFKSWAATKPDVRMVGGAAWYGCGLVREGVARFNDEEFDPAACGDLVSQWGRALDETQPQIAVVQTGPIEVDDHLLPGDSKWRAPGDPVFDRLLKARMLEAVDLFLDRGVVPIWLTSPRIEPSRSTQPPNDDPAGDPARMRRFNELLEEVARERPELRVVDLAAWLRRWPGGELDPQLRPDGVHFDETAAATEVSPWLHRQILRQYEAATSQPAPAP